MDKVILSLCDFSGAWSAPYRNAGYKVIQVDLKLGYDVRTYPIPDDKIHGILMAPPCTEFAGSGARWWKDKGDAPLLEALSIVNACLRFAAICKPMWWVLENPVGRLNRFIGKPVMYFNPCDYGDPYTQKTGLWGNFNPGLLRNPVTPTEGSMMWAKYGGKSDRTKELRSVTPMGFAKAFFEANP